MPVLKFLEGRLESLTGLSRRELEDVLFRLKCEVDYLDDGYVEVEVNPDRPDMYVGEGIARAVGGLLGRRRGWSLPKIVDSGLVLYNEGPPTRPYIAAAIVYNVNVTEDYIEELVQFQEKLHDTMGRRRRKAAIGLHDLSKLPSDKLYYKLASYDEEMTPLGQPGERTPLKRVLEETSQGKKYGSLSATSSGHPALYSGSEIIAIPPVINSEITRVEPGTRDLFIDVTGTDKATVEKILDIITTTLAEREGAYLGKVRIVQEGIEEAAPKLSTKTVFLDKDEPSRILGLPLDSFTISDGLSRMLHNVDVSAGGFRVEAPPFRVDILSSIDLVEDIAIAIGYEKIGENKPVVDKQGRLQALTLLARKIRDLAIGLGYTETMQLTLTSPRLLDLTGFTRRVEVENPVQQEYSVLRPSLIPSLLSTLSRNLHARKPVKVFEIGNVVVPGTPPPDEVRLGLAIMDEEVGYEDIQASVYSILRLLNIEFSVEPYKHKVFVEGRAARILSRGTLLGVMGEVNPEVLLALGVDYPVAVAELNLEVIAEWRSKTESP